MYCLATNALQKKRVEEKREREFCSYNSACANIFIHKSRRCGHNE